MTTRDQTRLCGLAFSLWIARNCGSKSRIDRETAVRNKRHEFRMAVRFGHRADCHKPQRDLINRRQLRASLAGIELYDRGTACGFDLAFPKWRAA